MCPTTVPLANSRSRRSLLSARDSQVCSLPLIDGRPAEDDDFADPVVVQTAGHYRLLAPLDGGAASRIFRGQSVFDDRPVAIKLLGTDRSMRRHKVELLLNGAVVVERLGWPGLLPVIATGWEADAAFVAMPIRESSLRDRFFGLLASPMAATLACAQIARMVAGLHAAGYAHGNLKLSNAFLDASELVLSDLALPDEMLTPHAPAAGSVQRADIAALCGLYSSMLGKDAPAACRHVVRARFSDMAQLADTLESTLRSLPSLRRSSRNGEEPRSSIRNGTKAKTVLPLTEIS